MRFSIRFTLLAMLAACKAAPTTLPAEITKRNVCDGVGATPILYHEYSGDACPPENLISPDGSCAGHGLYSNQCSTFCQVRTNFVYDVEIPFPNSYCHGPFTCTVTNTNTVTYTYTGSITPQWFASLKVGVTGGFSQATATAYARAYAIKLDTGSCGYFTFVPIRKDVCGTMSSAPVRYSFNDGKAEPYCGDNRNIGNFCASEARLNPDGSVDGDTIFVKTDCSNRQPLPLAEQDPVYQKPGVPLNRIFLDVILHDMGQESVPKCTSNCG